MSLFKKKPTKPYNSSDAEADNRTMESITVRGIAACIQAMAYPDFKSLNNILEQHGYQLVKK